MSGKTKILALLELDHNPAAIVDRAVWIAKTTDCDLELLLCDSPSGAFGHGIFVSNEAKEIGQNIRHLQEQVLEDLAEPARDQGLNVTTDILDDRPVAEGVLAKALNLNPRYVIKGTHFHSAADRGIMLDTDWQLIRICPFPLWLVKEGTFRDEPVIVAAVDPMHEHDKAATLDQAIVDAARAVGDPTGGDVHLFHTYQRLIGVGSAANKTIKPIKLKIDEIDKRIQNAHRNTLDKLANANGFDKDHVHQLPGRTRDILPTFVRSKKVDLVVMGALARWGFKRSIIGSTAERVLDHLPCDVLVVRAS